MPYIFIMSTPKTPEECGGFLLKECIMGKRIEYYAEKAAQLFLERSGDTADKIIHKEISDFHNPAIPLEKDDKDKLINANNKNQDDCALFFFSDTPTLTRKIINKILETHINSGAPITIVKNNLDTVAFAVSNSVLEAIFSKKECKELSFQILNSYLIEVGSSASVVSLGNDTLYRVNSIQLLQKAIDSIKLHIADRVMSQGALVMSPETTYISPETFIGKGTIIYPNCFFAGKNTVGENCVILPNCRLENMTIGSDVKMESTVAVSSSIGDHTTVGPFAYIRPGCKIGEHVKIGDFVEVKNSNVGNNTKASHLTYIGDADLGENINLGCGTITGNYDGKNKFRTVIEDNCFVGCNSNLLAPIVIREGAYIAAGSTINEEVPANSLSIARARQVNKANWVHPSDRKK